MWLSKKILAIAILFSLLSKLVFASETIVIAASPIPHADILRQIKPLLAKEGVNLEIREFNDYVQPNLIVAQNQADANYFQHLPYLTTFNHDHKTNLVPLVSVHLEPMGIYSYDHQKPKWLKDVKESLASDLKIGVPNDPTNEGRALKLLNENGFLTLKADAKYPTKKDVIKNPHNIKIIELDPAILTRMLDANQIDLAVINSNYALLAKIDPLKDALIIETAKNNPYANIIAVRPEDKNSAKIQKLRKAIESDLVRNYIKDHYHGAIIAAF